MGFDLFVGIDRKYKMQVWMGKLDELQITRRLSVFIFPLGVSAEDILCIGDRHGKYPASRCTGKKLSMRNSPPVGRSGQVIFDMRKPDDFFKKHRQI